MTNLTGAAIAELTRLSARAHQHANAAITEGEYLDLHRSIRAVSRVLTVMKPENVYTITPAKTSVSIRLTDDRVLVVTSRSVTEFLMGVDGIARRGRDHVVLNVGTPHLATVELVRAVFVLAVAE